MDDFKRIFSGKKRVLAVMPHPDDTELYCGGTVARLVAEGKRVRVVKMTFGDKGCQTNKITGRELKSIREKEDRLAMKALGIEKEDNIYLGIGDGEIEHNMETIGKIVYQIRVFQPELIITTNPEHKIIRYGKDINWVNHRDHINCANVTLDASYPYSRDILFFESQFKDKLVKAHICREFFLTDYYDHPDLISIDVSKHLETRIKAHAMHKSQYSLEDARKSADFFTRRENGFFERFRYVLTD